MTRTEKAKRLYEQCVERIKDEVDHGVARSVWDTTARLLVNIVAECDVAHCRDCDHPLLFSARETGRGLCGPCRRRHDGEETDEDRSNLAGELKRARALAVAWLDAHDHATWSSDDDPYGDATAARGTREEVEGWR